MLLFQVQVTYSHTQKKTVQECHNIHALQTSQFIATNHSLFMTFCVSDGSQYHLFLDDEMKRFHRKLWWSILLLHWGPADGDQHKSWCQMVLHLTSWNSFFGYRKNKASRLNRHIQAPSSTSAPSLLTFSQNGYFKLYHAEPAVSLVLFTICIYCFVVWRHNGVINWEIWFVIIMCGRMRLVWRYQSTETIQTSQGTKLSFSWRDTIVFCQTTKCQKCFSLSIVMIYSTWEFSATLWY